MKKSLLILPAAFLLAGCTLLPAKSTNITGTASQKAEKLSQIISAGGQADCKITNLVDKSNTQIIVSGKKMKIIGSDMGEGKKGTMINDTVYAYIWDDAEKKGIKSKLAPEITPSVTGAPDSEANTATEQALSYEDETKYQMNCTRRNISDSEFTPPADVSFTDFGEIMKARPSMPAIPSIPDLPD